MDRRDGNTSDTKFIDVFFDDRDGIYRAPYSESVEAVELIKKVLHD